MGISGRWALLAGTLTALATQAMAQQTASALVTFSIAPISKLHMACNPTHMVITQTPSGNIIAKTESTTAFAITTNMSSQRIFAHINADMPPGTTLEIDMDAPTGATSMGEVAMSTIPRVLVVGVSQIAESHLEVTYCLSATAQASNQGPVTRVVSYIVAP